MLKFILNVTIDKSFGETDHFYDDHIYPEKV